jgi:hypothetical protein
MRPPVSIVSLLGLLMILYKGKEVDKSWNNIKKQFSDGGSNYCNFSYEQIECLINSCSETG